tara:strand:- start:2 stop:592 length:591 start_codon:yes stop_codon:yes gene_type:complete
MDDVVRIPPNSFGLSLRKVATNILKAKYESTVNPEIGFMVLVTDVSVNSMGKIIPGEGSTYHRVQFSVLTFFPKIQEIVEGEILEITDFGAFVRIGPTDSLLHLSQITDDYLTSDVKQGMIIATQSKRTLSIGTKVRVRITAASLGKGTVLGKIGVTCRQPFLGALDWIEQDLQKAKATAKAKPATKAKPTPPKKK